MDSIACLTVIKVDRNERDKGSIPGIARMFPIFIAPVGHIHVYTTKWWLDVTVVLISIPL